LSADRSTVVKLFTRLDNEATDLAKHRTEMPAAVAGLAQLVSVVSVFRNVLTMRRSSEWTLTAEFGEDSSWQQTFQGPAGEFILNQGKRSIGVLTNKSFYQRTGTTTVRGTSAAWGTAPGETSIHWIEGDHGIQILSPDLRVPDLVHITSHLTE
jgi:hypothetical protein